MAQYFPGVNEHLTGQVLSLNISTHQSVLHVPSSHAAPV